MFARNLPWLDASLMGRPAPEPADPIPGSTDAPPIDPSLTDADQTLAAELAAECVVEELEQTWLPMHAGCAQCHGFCFAMKDDVTRQLGVCGCVVANEMELAALESAPRNDGGGGIVLSHLALNRGFPVAVEFAMELAQCIQGAVEQPPEKKPDSFEAARRQRPAHGAARVPQHALAKRQVVTRKTHRLGQRGS
jgi:hypothetical protein|uniref:Uncharacterized protein n=1 Tax=Prymnesium polylepis TaxID=72548 RepID=A0A6T8ARB7_9EUKA|mmetsp:Transcript_34144/g.85658  ORF Transcript_34144/g.85658 Transcript_34144/m.85658 type:complete len:194 (+) Transcript_34144:59-640(+)|eukprot:2161458-Prymnesium_polylepis.1